MRSASSLSDFLFGTLFKLKGARESLLFGHLNHRWLQLSDVPQNWNMHEEEQLSKLLLVNLNALLENGVWFGAHAHLPLEKRHMKGMQYDS